MVNLQELRRNGNEPTWDLLTLSRARTDKKFHESLTQPEDHAHFVFEGLQHLIGLENSTTIARILAIINEINVINPRVIGQPHSALEINRYGKLLTAYPHYLQNSKDVYEYILKSLSAASGFAHLQDKIGDTRQQSGIATPLPTEVVIQALAKLNGLDKTFAQLSLDEVEKLLASAANIDVNTLSKFTNINFVFTSTGIGRNIAVRPVFAEAWKNGHYIEVGGSVGIHPLELKQSFTFVQTTSADILSEAESNQITFISDYEKKVPLTLTPEMRHTINENVKLVFSFDATKNSLSELVTKETEAPLIIGIHNVLVHLVEKEKIIANAINALGQRHGYLWTSGGYNGNEPVLYNFILEINQGKVLAIFKDQYNTERTGGKGIDISSLSEMQAVFREERG